jgi:YbbR domain-containing protein
LKKRNIFIWALSFVIAVTLWAYVVFVENPEGEKIVGGIPVEFRNESALASRNLILVGGEDETVTVKFSGRIQNIARISNENVKAVIDLRGATTYGSIAMRFTLETDVPDLESDPLEQFVYITVDRFTSRYIPVELDFAGEMAEGFELDPPQFNPSQIHILGPSQEIESVHRAVVRYQPADLFIRTLEDWAVGYTLYTQDGQPVESGHIRADYEDVWLTLPVRMVKTVPLSLDLNYGGGLAGENIALAFEPASVRISGDPELLDGIKTISLGRVDLASMTENTVKDYAIHYPEGVRDEDNVHTAEASIQITGVSTRDIVITNVSASGILLPEGYTFTVSPITVTLRGPADEIHRAEAHNIRVTADFSGAELHTPGLYRRPAVVEVTGLDKAGAVDKGYEATVTVMPDTAGLS